MRYVDAMSVADDPEFWKWLFGALIAPVTSAVLGFAKYRLDSAKQKHELELASTKQRHEIEAASAKQKHELASASSKQEHDLIASYLDRALNPELSLLIRQQYLRFLAAKGTGQEKLGAWATSELAEVSKRLEPGNRAVERAEEEREKAKTPEELRLAEERLRHAISALAQLGGQPAAPAVSPGALRAGFLNHRTLHTVTMQDSNLDRADLADIEFVDADFSGTSFRQAHFQGVRLKSANLSGCDFTGAVFLSSTDLRGADLRGATFVNLRRSAWPGVALHLHGADLSTAVVSSKLHGVVYDETTKWPEGFDPSAAGALLAGTTAESAD